MNDSEASKAENKAVKELRSSSAMAQSAFENQPVPLNQQSQAS